MASFIPFGNPGLFEDFIQNLDVAAFETPLMRGGKLIRWEVFEPLIHEVVTRQAKGPGGRPRFYPMLPCLPDLPHRPFADLLHQLKAVLPAKGRKKAVLLFLWHVPGGGGGFRVYQMRGAHNPEMPGDGKKIRIFPVAMRIESCSLYEPMATTHRLFPTTSESLVDQLNAPEQKLRETALAAFCAVYYPPIYGYARAMGFQEADAQDRVQDFFMEVVRRDMLQRYSRDTGSRFSTWLITCFKNLVFNHQAKSRSQKMGGKLQFVEFDATHAEQSYQTSYLSHLDPDPTFDLMLAREVWRMARPAIMALHQGRSSQALVFDILQYVVMDRWPPKPEPSQEEVAARHGTTPTRLKAFFTRTLKVQARRCFDNAGQLASPGIPDSELDHLWHLLSHYGEA